MKPKAEFPPNGLGHEDGKSEGDKAVKAIKLMAVNCIECKSACKQARGTC